MLWELRPESPSPYSADEVTLLTLRVLLRVLTGSQPAPRGGESCVGRLNADMERHLKNVRPLLRQEQ